ncbi:hypothetical protein EF834_06325 [Rhodococcus spongiicola]|uniref:Uncharacterized protein n=1 Tax=Rhodococcus spongiicola TaxID=2487352 RepID=A0A3S3CSL1_9NOCA|nr:hypothetical protein EF834_06325 [Rhodococcus spongiicola]
MLWPVLNGIEKVIVPVSAHQLDSFRSVERRARKQWARLLADRGESWRDAGLHLVDSRPDSEMVDHLVYRFEGTTVTCASVS